MNDKYRFGQFILEMRKKRSMNLQELAQKLGISIPYLSQLERGVRCNPSIKLLESIAMALQLNTTEKYTLFDLYAKANKTISPDLIEYIYRHNTIVRALRLSKEIEATDEIWLDFINKLQNR